MFPYKFYQRVITVSIIYGRAPANWNNASACSFLRKSSRFIVKIAMTRTAMAALLIWLRHREKITTWEVLTQGCAFSFQLDKHLLVIS
jgi:hypothetical protein